MQDYTVNHLDKLDGFVESTMRETGDIQPFFVFHTRDGEQYVVQMNQESMADQGDKISLAIAAHVIVGLCEGVVMVSMVTGAYTLDSDMAIEQEFAGHSVESAHRAACEKYGSIQSSPYGKEIVMATTDSEKSFWTMMYDVNRVGDVVSVAQGERHEVVLSEEENARELQGSGIFMGLHNNGMRIRRMLADISGVAPVDLNDTEQVVAMLSSAFEKKPRCRTSTQYKRPDC